MKFSKIFYPFIVLASIPFLFSACARYASERSLDYICLNMPKEEVIYRMNNMNGVARGAILNKYGQSIEVREYQIQKPRTGAQVGAQLAFTALTFGLGAPILLAGGEVNTYWLFFYNNRLVRWGQAGDWKEAEKTIYDINFNISYN